MALNAFRNFINNTANELLSKLERYFEADVLAYFGPIYPAYESVFRDAIEGLVAEQQTTNHSTLVVVLQTNGGSVETTEKYVNMIRRFYDNVYFVIPTYAMSAGTVFCMSGNKIYMDYSSSLGPIDPQVYSQKTKSHVPVLGYISAFEEMREKSSKNELSDAEFAMLVNQIDLAFLDNCRKSSELSEKLLKSWLVKYKFRDWHKTKTRGLDVTKKMKEDRAVEIAKLLGNNSEWNIHSRPIMIKDLENMNLIIDDFTGTDLQPIIRQYTDFINQYLQSYSNVNFDVNLIHTRLFM